MNIKTTTKRSVLGGLFLSLALVSCGEKSKIQSHLDNGEKYYQAGNFDEAKVEFLNLRQRDPKNATAHARLGEIYLRQGSPYQAVPYLLEARKLDPDSEDVELHLAEASLLLGALVDARKNALAVVGKSPSRERALVILAETAYSEELFEETRTILEVPASRNTAGGALAIGILANSHQDAAEAEAAFREALVKTPGYSKAHLALAHLLRAQKNVEEAEVHYRKAAEFSASRSSEKLAYAQFLLQSGRTEDSRAYLEVLTEETPDYLPAWITLAHLALGRNELERAEELLQNALLRDNAQHEARLLQARIQMVRGQPKEVLENLKQLRLLYPKMSVLEYQLAIAYLMNGKPSMANVVLDRALQLEPRYLEARLLKANLDLGEAKPALVIDSLQKIVEEATSFTEAQYLLAAAYRMLGRLEPAADIFRARLDDEPDDFQAHLFLGMILRQQGKVVEARATFERAGSLEPGDPTPSFQLAEMDLLAGDQDRAIARIEEVLQRKPDSEIAHFMMGQVYAIQKSWGRAEESLLKAIELNPKLNRAYNLLLDTYVAAKKLPEARAELEGYIANNPSDASALIQLALVQEKLGEFQAAELAYQRAISILPDFAPALNNLAWLYVDKLHEPGKGLSIALKARGLQPDDGGIADTLGWIYYQQKDYPRAVALLREAAPKLPGDPQVSYRLGMAAYMMGETELARKAFKRAVEADSEFEGKKIARERLTQLTDADGASADETAAELRARLAVSPNDPVLLLKLASALEKEQEHQAAKDTYEKLLAISPKHFEGTIALARLCHEILGDSDRAVELARGARSLDASDSRPLAILGAIELASGRSKQALVLLSEALEAGSSDPRVVHSYGWAAYQTGDPQRARESMARVLQIEGDPQLTEEATVFLALTRSDLAPTPEIVAQAQKILTAKPEFLPAQMILATQARSDQEVKTAMNIYTSILSRHPDFWPAQFELARLLAEEGENVEQAKKLLQQVRRGRPGDLTIARLLGEISVRLQDHSYAIQLLEEVNRAQKLDAEGLFYLATAQSALSPDSAEGLANFKRALDLGLPKPLQDKAQALLSETPE